MDQFWIGLLCPASRGCVDLIWERAHGGRDRDTFRSENGELALPIETSRRDRRIRQPIERDIVEDVVACQAFGFSVEDSCDQRQAASVMIEHPGGEADRGVCKRVQRLWPVRHLLRVTESVLV